MNKIGILTSGGDAPGMNAALRSAVRVSLDLGIGIFGISEGYQGMVEGGKMIRDEAQSYARLLCRDGKADWRLPAVSELETLLDRTRFGQRFK